MLQKTALNFFKGSVKDNTDVNSNVVYTVPVGATAVIKDLFIFNTDPQPVDVTVKIGSQTIITTTISPKDTLFPPGNDRYLVMEANETLTVVASKANVLDARISGVTLTAVVEG